MKFASTKIAACLLGCALLLVACGGGSDDQAGSPTPFSIIPDSITLTGPVGSCGVSSGDVYVFGGVAPYQILNTVPGYVTVNKTTVAHQKESFTVTFLGGCLDPGSIAVIDSLGNQVVLKLVNQKGT